MKAKCTACKKVLSPTDNRVTYAKDPQKRPFCPDCCITPMRKWVGETFFGDPWKFVPIPPHKPKKSKKK